MAEMKYNMTMWSSEYDHMKLSTVVFSLAQNEPFISAERAGPIDA